MKLLRNSLLILLSAQFPLDLKAQNCFDEIKDLPINSEELSISSLSDFLEKKKNSAVLLVMTSIQLIC